MTRNVPLSFLEIEVNVDEIKKYVGKPIIYHHFEEEDLSASLLVSGILTGVDDNQIYIEKISYFQGEQDIGEWDDETMRGGGEWILRGFDDFSEWNADGPHLVFKFIQFMYVSKIDATLEQMQNSVVNSEEPMTSLEKIMCIYCWKTFPEENLKEHQKICDDFIGTCPKCHDGFWIKDDFYEHFTCCNEPFTTPEIIREQKITSDKIIKEYGSFENYYDKCAQVQEQTRLSNQRAIKKQFDAWKRMKDKKR